MAKCCDPEMHEWVPSDNPQHVGGMVCQACGRDIEDATIDAEDYTEEDTMNGLGFFV